MYLTVKTIRGNKYLYLMKSQHVPGKRNPVKTIVKSYGLYDNVPEDIRKDYEDKKKRTELANRLEQQARADALVKAQSKMHAVLQCQEQNAQANSIKDGGGNGAAADTSIAGQNTTNFNRAYTLGYGHLALREIWADELGLAYKISYLQKSKTQIRTWQLNDLLYYLCSLKLLDPQSYFSACAHKSNFLYCPWNDIEQDNFYRALDFVYTHKDTLIQHAVKSHREKTKTKVELAFFDCTNTWFETPYDDLVWQIIRFERKIREDKEKEGLSQADINKYLEGDEYAEKPATELALREEEVLRMRGKSKEGRFARPIVTVALAIDQTGFPIDCGVFAGNLSEVHTVKPMLDKLKEKYSVERAYFVADRGLNSTAALGEVQRCGLGFVVARKVSMQKPEIRAQMLSLNGYRNGRLRSNGTFETFDGKLWENACRYKVCDYTKQSRVAIEGKTPSGRNKTKKVTVNCKIVYTFSPERQARDLAELEEKIRKAQNAIDQGMLMGNPNGTGYRALIQTEKEMVKDKADKEQYRARGLKQNVIAERREIAGYAAIVFSRPQGHEDSETTQADFKKLTDEQVIEIYHRLVGIEGCFRVMKGNFSIRPMNVRLTERITAHCYLCVLALMMLKSVQEKLEHNGLHLSPERICRALADAKVLPLPADDGSIQTFVNVGAEIKFHTPENTGKLGKAQKGLNDTVNHDQVWESFEKTREQQPCDTDLVLMATGWQPLKLYNTMGELKRIFRLKNQPDDVMVAIEHRNHIRKLAEA